MTSSNKPKGIQAFLLVASRGQSHFFPHDVLTITGFPATEKSLKLLVSVIYKRNVTQGGTNSLVSSHTNLPCVKIETCPFAQV